ncbi:MAG TPA: formate dehydrogenase, partial [Acidimicrobiaceae bacterium]|nr:formate dehydrogenase [Acidimicrobiaceae bacterium]
KADRKPEWWIAHRLLQEMGRPSLFDGLDESAGDEPDPWSKWRHMVERGGDVSFAALQAGEVAVLPAPEPGSFYDRQVHTSDGRVDCCPPVFTEAIERCHSLFAEATARPADELLLIHQRDPWMHNSWFANLPRMKKGGRTTNPLRMHPADAERLGVTDGATARVASQHGEVEATVEVVDDLMPGVVSMVHGWGHAASPRLKVAAAAPGANPNALLPVGPGSYEPLSSQAHMTGIPVSVQPITA